VSKHHQSSRRKAYGRRQHELRERLERSHPSDLVEFDLGPDVDDREGFPFHDVDLGSRRLGLAMGD
jgi:hypothetical protein